MTTITQSQIKRMSPQLVVSDLNASISFYTGKLDFELEFCYDDFYAGICKDGFSIHLKTGKPAIEERNRKRESQDLDIVFSVDGVEALFTKYLNQGIDIVQPLCERPYGKEFYIADPDGYIFAYLEEA